VSDDPKNPFKTPANPGRAVHPDSPAGGSGPGFAPMPAPLRRVPYGARTPHPQSPAARHFPWQIELPKTGGGEDDSFKFTATRSGGLTPKETALLERAHTFFGLDLGAEGKIAGVLILPNGSAYALVSGKHGGPQGGTQDGFIPRGPGSGITRYNVTHIEGHTSAILHRVAMDTLSHEKVAEAALLIPKQPCGACDPNIPNQLPSGTRLFVVDPGSTTMYRSSTGASLVGERFIRTEELQFKVPTGMLRVKSAGRFLGKTYGTAAAMAALSILVGWLRGKLEADIIESQIKKLQPEIEKALQDHVEEVLDIVARKDKPWANLALDVWRITTSNPEPGGPAIVDSTLPVVKFIGLTVGSHDISQRDPDIRKWDGFQFIVTTPMIVSIEIDLL
jgi:hypothetical protein